MEGESRRGRFGPPGQPDSTFGVVAGLYLAALLSPALLFPVVRWLEVDSYRLAVGVLGVTGACIAALGARLVTRQRTILLWFESTWQAALVPAAGLLPLVGYAFEAFVFVGVSVADLQPESAANFVGFLGFVSGFGAVCLGAMLVQMARNRLVDATVEGDAVVAEWTASWPHRARITLGIRFLAAICPVAGVVYWQAGTWGLVVVLQFVAVLAGGVGGLTARRTYRVTPDGLEIRRDGWVTSARRFVPWSEFDGFSVTDDGVVLHRGLPHLSVRCAQWGLDVSDTDVVTTLERHLDRRG